MLSHRHSNRPVPRLMRRVVVTLRHSAKRMLRQRTNFVMNIIQMLVGWVTQELTFPLICKWNGLSLFTPKWTAPHPPCMFGGSLRPIGPPVPFSSFFLHRFHNLCADNPGLESSSSPCYKPPTKCRSFPLFLQRQLPQGSRLLLKTQGDGEELHHRR